MFILAVPSRCYREWFPEHYEIGARAFALGPWLGGAPCRMEMGLYDPDFAIRTELMPRPADVSVGSIGIASRRLWSAWFLAPFLGAVG